MFRPGTDAALHWNLPPSSASIITIGLQANGQVQAVFYCFMAQAKIQADPVYADRIDILEGLGVGNGLVSFTLENVTVDDAGRYVCIDGVGVEPFIDDCGQVLVIVGKPTDVAVVASSPPIEGQDLTLECNATSTTLPPDHKQPLRVQWFDSDQNILTPGVQEKEHMQGALLIVRSVQRHDLNLRYSCRASDGLEVWSDRSAAYVLVPEYAPKESDIKMDRHKAEVSQGGSLQVQCSATCNPNCTIVWEKEGDEGSWYTVETVEGLLDQSNIQRPLAGNLRCRAENIHGSASQHFLLLVHYAPNLQQLSINGKAGGKANVKESTNVTMACTFDSSPAPSVDWFRVQDQKTWLRTDNLDGQDPVVVREGLQRSLYTSEFVLTTAACSDTGVYECAAKNNLGSGISGRADLHVVCMPRNTYGDLRLRELYLLPAHDSVNIRFQVEAYPQPSVTRMFSEDEGGHRRREYKDDWIASSSHTKSHPYLTTFRLRMLNPIASYFDRTFYLDIENSEGTKTLAFMLREKGVPKPPRNVTAVWTEDTWVRLHWTPGFHGGKPQTFAVQYKDAELSEDGAWITAPSQFQGTEEDSPQELEVGGLQPGHTYTFRVLARNEYGNSSSLVLSVTTLATAAASADAGAIAGAVIAVIIILVIVILVLVFVFIIRPRRRKQKSKKDFSTEPMLSNGDKNTEDTTATVAEEDDVRHENSSPTDTANNNADRDTSTEPLITSQTSSDRSPDDRPRNQDGLIYADLDLAKPKDLEAKTERKETVNYETIDFTRQAPPAHPANPDSIELASDEEELPSKK